jgi:hypothetical protein
MSFYTLRDFSSSDPVRVDDVLTVKDYVFPFNRTYML